MLKRFLTGKRVVICAYLSLGAFLLAHTVNAFVADVLWHQPIQISALDLITELERPAESSRALADAIVTSGLFLSHLARAMLLPQVRLQKGRFSA